MMKMLQQRKGYLYGRLSAIMEKRSPEQADVIRNQYKVMAEEAAAEAAAKQENEEELEDRKMAKMLRFLENYARV